MRENAGDSGLRTTGWQDRKVSQPSWTGGISLLQRLRNTVAAPAPAPVTPLAADIAFLMYHNVPLGPLWRATERARYLGVPARRCLIAEGAVSTAQFTQLLARHVGVSAQGKVTPDPKTRLVEALRQGWFRAQCADGASVMAVDALGPAMPMVLNGIKAAQRGHIALLPPQIFREALRQHFAADIAAQASASVPDIDSSRTGMTLAQRWSSGLFLALLLLGLVIAPRATITLAPLLFGFVFLGAAAMHLAACWEGRVLDRPVAERDDARLPSYSVLVPLHREAEIIPQLVEALSGLDYPREKLQVFLVVEENDAITQSAIAQVALPAHISKFVAPDGQPRTKPRALNATMPFVTGELIVVYDAEDQPDPLQLRQAAAMFRTMPANVACLQARLAIDNAGDGPLSTLFTIEYAALFDVTKSGSARLGFPIPLGGTSNHFRTSVLRRIGLWDAWNVTEDADLGLRLARYGYGVADLNSTTHEESPSKLSAWMAQRTRWLKGWLQTIVTHSRQPLTVWRQLGTMDMFAATALSAGVVIGTMLAPLFHVMVVVRILSPDFLAGLSPVDLLADAFIIVLGVAGLLSVFVPALMATRRRNLKGLRRWIPVLPLYHLLMTLAAWRAVYELVVDPHRWNKTSHGHARTSRKASLAQKQ